MWGRICARLSGPSRRRTDQPKPICRAIANLALCVGASITEAISAGSYPLYVSCQIAKPLSGCGRKNCCPYFPGCHHRPLQRRCIPMSSAGGSPKLSPHGWGAFARRRLGGLPEVLRLVRLRINKVGGDNLHAAKWFLYRLSRPTFRPLLTHKHGDEACCRLRTQIYSPPPCLWMLAFCLASAESEALPDARACFAGSTGAVLPVLWGRVAATRTTRKREPDSSGTLRPPFRTARVPCSAFFTGRPLSCALSLERAGPVTASELPKPRYPRRLNV